MKLKKKNWLLWGPKQLDSLLIGWADPALLIINHNHSLS